MLIYMDESGDNGLKPTSSPRLVVTAVAFRTEMDALACAESICCLSAALGDEYRFHDLRPEPRLAFLSAVAGHPFEFWSVICHKSRLVQPRRWQPSALRHEVAGRVIDLMIDSLAGSKLVFDTLGGKPTDQAMSSALRKRAKLREGKPRLGDAKPGRSKSVPLLQLADMVCGSVAHSFLDDCSDAGCYRHTVRRSEQRVVEWPVK